VATHPIATPSPLPIPKQVARPGTLDTLPDWWGKTRDGGSLLLNYGDIRFPSSGAIAPDLLLPFAYGQVRVGGTAIQFTPVPGSEQTHGWGVVAWCTGEIGSIDAILCGANVLPAPYDAAPYHFHYDNYPGVAGGYLQDATSDIFCPYPRTHGGSGAAGPFDVSNLAGVAYTRFDLTSDVYYYQWWRMLPNGTQDGTYQWAADVHGLKIFDPRGGGSTAYSNNPALIVRDLLKRFGHLTDGELDDTSFANAADACDSAGFTCNVAFATKTTLADALAVVLQTCNGTPITSNGKRGLWLDVPNAAAPVATLSEEDGDLWDLGYEWVSARDRYTRLAVSFANAAAGYKKDQTPDFDDPGIALGTVPIKALVVNAPGITTLAAAIILRDYLYNAQAITFRISGTMRGQGIALRQGQKIRLKTLKGVDLDCLLLSINGDSSGFFPFLAKPYEAGVYGSTPISGSPPISLEPPNQTEPGGDVTVTDATGERSVASSSSSRVTVYEIFQLVTFTLPVGGVAISELRVRGFAGTGAGTKTWADMVASEIVVPLSGNETPIDGTHSRLSHSGVVKTTKTLTFDAFGRLVNTSTATGPTRLIVRTATALGALSTGVTVDVAQSSTSVDEGGGGGLPPADIGRGTIIEQPAGIIDGSNTVFVCSHVPSSSRILFAVDGQVLNGGVDYSRTGATITMRAGANPPRNSTLVVYTYGDIPDGHGNPEDVPLGEAAAWTEQSVPVRYRMRGVAWAPELNLFVAVGADDYYTRILSSPDGVTWTERGTPTGGMIPSAIAWSGSRFVVVSQIESGSDMFRSTNGIDWTQDNMAMMKAFTCVVWGNNKFVALANSGPNATRADTSADGITWANHDMGTSRDWTGIAYSDSLGLYVGVSTDAVSQGIATSTDGESWTMRNSPDSTGGWEAVCWSPGIGMFVAVGANRVMHSTNGVDWTLGTIASKSWRAVTWHSPRGLFVAVNDTASGTEGIATSTNGLDWTLQNTPHENNRWRAVCSAASIDTIVAVAGYDDAGTNPMVLRSVA
jgi:hypothetical protein